MRNVILSAVTLAAVLNAAPALALNAKSYVSNGGSDGNSCASPAAACATFQGAHDKTAPGGEISVVNTGSYGTMFIQKSIDITNDGAGEASVLVPSGAQGIFLAAAAGDVVGLRGLVVDGQGPGLYGMQVALASAVHVQKCVFRNFEALNGTGIAVLGQTNVQVFISDTVVFNNGSNPQSGGIIILTSAGVGAYVVLDRVHLENNVIGLWVDGTSAAGNGSHVVIRNSVVSGNAGDGILALSAPGKAPAFIMVEQTDSVNNAGTGIKADGPGATILLNDNTVVRNGVGLAVANGGQLISYGNNKVNNNLGPDGVPTGNYSPL